jgi:hypothetical protein
VGLCNSTRHVMVLAVRLTTVVWPRSSEIVAVRVLCNQNCVALVLTPVFGFLRYLHYYQRYHGHESALKYAAAQRAQAEARMVEQQEAQKTSWIDVQFLKQAAEQVRISCVTTLYLRCFWKPDVMLCCVVFSFPTSLVLCVLVSCHCL